MPIAIFQSQSQNVISWIFFYKQTAQALRIAIVQAETISWDAEYIHQHAQKFSKANFKMQIKDYIDHQISIFSNIWKQYGKKYIQKEPGRTQCKNYFWYHSYWTGCNDFILATLLYTCSGFCFPEWTPARFYQLFLFLIIYHTNLSVSVWHISLL